MNAFRSKIKIFEFFFQEKVAGIKKGFTFALPITTTICKTKEE